MHAHRILQGLSQVEAAAQLGVSFQQFQKYETGTNRISAAALLVLACAWNKPITWLFPDPTRPMDIDRLIQDVRVLNGLSQLNTDQRQIVRDLITHLARRC